MFNVTIIKLRDIFKILIIVILIYVLSGFVFKKDLIKNWANKTINNNNVELLKLGIDSQSAIIKDISTQKVANEEENNKNEEDKDLAIKSILELGLSTFKIKESEVDLGQDNESTLVENTDIATEIRKEASVEDNTPTDVGTQVVTANPIAENYNKQFNGIKIKNETSYELTDDMLNADSLETDNKNIIIFHTHTCESYTEGENSKYIATREF